MVLTLSGEQAAQRLMFGGAAGLVAVWSCRSVMTAEPLVKSATVLPTLGAVRPGTRANLTDISMVAAPVVSHWVFFLCHPPPTVSSPPELSSVRPPRRV